MKILKLLVLQFLFNACSSSQEEYATEHNIFDASSASLGTNDYGMLFQAADDSINNWVSNGLQAWVIDSSTIETMLDTVYCTNKRGDKVIMAHIGRQLTSLGRLDGIGYIYGVKITEQWYFFGGPTAYISRDEDSLNSPTSFTKLHEIAMENIFSGYLKKNKETGEWEINDAFFARFYERDAYNFPFTTQEAWDESWLRLMRENWKHRDTTNYEPLR